MFIYVLLCYMGALKIPLLNVFTEDALRGPIVQKCDKDDIRNMVKKRLKGSTPVQHRTRI